MKGSGKVAFRLFKKHFARFMTIVAIVLVSVGFMSGIGEVENKIKIATREEYAEKRIADLYLKSSLPRGFSEEDIAAVAERYGEENVKGSFCYETDEDGQKARVYTLDMESEVSRITVAEGRLPQAANEVAVEEGSEAIISRKIGESVEIFQPLTQTKNRYVIVGIVQNPLHIYGEAEQSFTDEGKHLVGIYYFHSEGVPVINDLYVYIGEEGLGELLSDEYVENIEKEREETQALLGGAEMVSVLTLRENIGIYSLFSYAEKVGTIGVIFVVFFLLITLLVVYSTTSRLLDEERGQIACQKTLGFSDWQVTRKYLLFVLTGTVIGGALAFLVGLTLTSIIYEAFSLQYRMPPFPKSLNFYYYSLTFGIILLAMGVLTYFSGKKAVAGAPARLLTPKTPKAGKKVFLERIPFIWRALSFKYKSTVRNILLFKSRFFMTVLSVIGGTVLVFAGMGLLDCADNSPSIIAISAVLIIFSAVLCALVIYNLTNINVSERTREIATLMVLGYREREVTGYIYREIYIMCAIGAVFGLPLGVGFVQFVFGLINFGTLAEIQWTAYVLTPVVIMLFGFVSTLLLRHKILKTDMNASLKTVE